MLALWCALALSACTLGPDFHQPDVKLPNAYAASGDAPMPADQHLLSGQELQGQWWEELKSPALDGVIKLALSQNLDLQAAKARVAQVDEQVVAAEGALLPQVSLAAQSGRQKYGATMFGPLDIHIPAYTYYSAGANISIPLDVFGATRRMIEENQARADYQRHEQDGAYLSLTGNVVMQALVVAASDAELAAMQQVIASDRKLVQLQTMAVDSGSMPKQFLLDAQDQLARDQARLPGIQMQLTRARHALAILVGKAPADWSPPAFSLDDFRLPTQIPAAMPSQLVHRRPDILAAEAQLHAASAAIGVATANLYPRIDLTAAYAFQSLTAGALFNGAGAAWSVAAAITQPLYDGGQRSAERRAAIDAYQAALADYKQVLLTSFGEVADRLEALAQDSNSLQAQTAMTQAASSALELSQAGYRQGYTNALELCAKQRLGALAQAGLAQARAQRLADTASLLLALGGSTIDGQGSPQLAANGTNNK